MPASWVNGNRIGFQCGYLKKPELVAWETQFYLSRWQNLNETVINLQPSLKRVRQELRIAKSLVANRADLTNKAGKLFPILPGMVARVEIKTGQKTVLDYLIKPLNKVKESLRER